MIEIVFYEKENGERPAQIFLDSLDLKMQAKMMRTILLLAQNGSALREPYSKYLRNGIFELRERISSLRISAIMRLGIGLMVGILTSSLIISPPPYPRREATRLSHRRRNRLYVR